MKRNTRISVLISIVLMALLLISCRDTQKPMKKEQTKLHVQNTQEKRLNLDPFKESMKEMNEKRYEQMEKMVLESDIKAVQNHLKQKDFTVEELVTFYIKRIEQYDIPKYHTVLQINPDAIKIAKKLDQKQENQGRLYGIPILIKGNISTGDKMFTSAGAKALENSYADRDSFLVSQLRKEDAIILGQANLSEFANFMSTKLPIGYSDVGGQPINPYGKFVTGGSSSGSGAAVAANFSLVTIGSETSGSLVSPAMQNNVVTIKPSLGLVSRDRIIPLSPSFDTAGPMARSVEDATILFNSMTGVDQNDIVTKDAAPYEKIDYTKYLKKDGLKDMKIGMIVQDKLLEYEPEYKKVYNNLEEELKKVGAVVKRVSYKDTVNSLDLYKVFEYEFNEGMKNYLKAVGNKEITNVKDIIEYNKEDLQNRAKYGQDLIEKSANQSYKKDEIEKLVKNMRQQTQKIMSDLLQNNDVDMVVTPNVMFCRVYATAGYPAVCVPAGYKNNQEPYGIIFSGKKFDEGKLIQAAYAYEQGTHHRKEAKLEIEK